MGPRWAEICSEFTDTISQLGPSPINLALLSKEDMESKKKQEA